MNISANVQKIYTVAYYTAHDLLKSRLLLNVLLMGVGLIIITLVATEFTYGVPERIAMDFGLGCLSLSCNIISLLLGLSLISKELDSRTVYMVVSRPVPRYTFFLGKIFGIAFIQIVNVVLLASLTYGLIFLLGGTFNSVFNWALFYVLLEAWLLLFTVVFISLIANSVITFICSLLLLIIGHGISDAFTTNLVLQNPLLKKILVLFNFVLPAFHKLNLKDYVVYSQSLDTDFLFKGISYFIAYSLFLIWVSLTIFEKKNLD